MSCYRLCTDRCTCRCTWGRLVVTTVDEIRGGMSAGPLTWVMWSALSYPRAGAATFLAGVKGGEFDDFVG